MNFLEKTVAQINSAEYATRFPDIANNIKDNKIHVLYIAPFLTGIGLYRALLPAIELNKTTTHKAIVNQMELWSEEKVVNGFEVQLNDEIIRWADYVVFQTSFHNLAEDIKVFKEINKKSHLRFCMDIDDNYHEDQLDQDPVNAAKMRDKLLKNMSVCDIIIPENKNLANYYMKKLIENAYTVPRFEIMPNFMSNDVYEGLQPYVRKATDKIRIGMIFNPTQFRDVNPFRKILIETKKRYKDKVELVTFGWNGILPRPFRDCLHGVEKTHFPKVPVTQYFQKLIDLHFDIALQPLQDTVANQCKSYHKTLQYSQIGIPVICSQVEPYINCVQPKTIPGSEAVDETKVIPALVASTNEEWHQHIETLVKDPALRQKAGEAANITVQEYYTWHTNIEILQNLFK